MKWIDFSFCVLIDLLFLTHIVLVLGFNVRPTSDFELIFDAITFCVLAAVTALTYKEARNG